MSFLEFRKKHYKAGLDCTELAAARTKLLMERRRAFKTAIIAENRRERVSVSATAAAAAAAAATATGLQDTAFELQASQFDAWKATLRGEDGACIEHVCRQVEELVLAVCEGRLALPASTDYQLQLLQVCYQAYRHLPGRAIIPVLNFFVEALKCSVPDIVRVSCLSIHAAMARSGSTAATASPAPLSAIEAVWAHAKDPIGCMMASMPTQAEEVQKVMMLCIILALEDHTAARLAKVLPLFIEVLKLGPGNMLCLMVMDCIAELAYSASIEELFYLREGGILTLYVAMVAAADEDKAPCIETALEVMAAYAAHEDSAPTAWLVAAGGLAALECLLDAPWLEEDIVVSICSIVANATLSAPEAVVSRTLLCESIVQWIEDGEADEEVRTEALSVLINAAVFAGGVDSVRCLSLVEAGAFSAFVAASMTFAAHRHTIKHQHILTAVSNMLNASPEQAHDFAECGGIEMLKHAVSVSFGDTAGHMAMRILRDHFPVVLGV